MIYLSGGHPKQKREMPQQFGAMLSPMKGNYPHPGQYWGVDNGCFAHPDKFKLTSYYEWLVKRKPDLATCLFAVAPDVVGNAPKTLARSLPVMPVIRAIGYPVAFVAQDGIQAIEIPWDEFDCLFVGGTTEFKFSEPACVAVDEAQRRGKWCHLGRVNSRQRLMAAVAQGYDSADGTHIAFEPDVGTARVLRWIDRANTQLPLTYPVPTDR